MEKIEPKNKQDVLKIAKYFNEGNEYFIAVRKNKDNDTQWLIKIKEINKINNESGVMVRCILLDNSEKAKELGEDEKYNDFKGYDTANWEYFLLDKGQIDNYYKQLLAHRIE